MAFKLRSQNGPGDLTVGASGSSQEKSVGVDLNYSKGPISATAAGTLGMMSKGAYGEVNYNAKKLGVSLSANKYAGQKAGVDARVTYRF